jgi:hypothetical protein
VAQVIKSLPKKPEALSSSPCTAVLQFYDNEYGIFVGKMLVLFCVLHSAVGINPSFWHPDIIKKILLNTKYAPGYFPVVRIQR